MAQDPLLFRAGDPNIYRYVGNSPTNAIDPSGLEEVATVSKTVPPPPPPGYVAPSTGLPPGPGLAQRFWGGVATVIDTTTGGIGTKILTSKPVGAYTNGLDQFYAGWGGQLTGGGLLHIRDAIYGPTATQNHSGPLFIGGQVVGIAHQIAMAAAGGRPVAIGRGGGGVVNTGGGALGVVAGGVNVTINIQGVLTATYTGVIMLAMSGTPPPTSPTPPGPGSTPADEIAQHAIDRGHWPKKSPDEVARIVDEVRGGAQNQHTARSGSEQPRLVFERARKGAAAMTE